MQLRQSMRRAAKMRLALAGASGSGKTYSSLLIAYGMTGDWSKIAVIDSENCSADLYAHLGNYQVLTLDDYAPETYIEAIAICEQAGAEVIIIDSISHCWDYLLDYHANLQGNSFANWAKVSPRQNAFIQRILTSSAHIICTMRSKQDYVLSDKNGKMVPEKVGLKAVQRDNVDYEFTAVLDIAMNHKATTSKDRTGLFTGKPEFVITPQVGQAILRWCNLSTNVQPQTLCLMYNTALQPNQDFATSALTVWHDVAQQQTENRVIPLSTSNTLHSRHFIEANTKAVDISHLREDCIVPVFSKDNELTISHQMFIETILGAAYRMFPNEAIDAPDIVVSHIIKGRIPEAIHKPVNQLLETDKTIYYERMAFCFEIPTIYEDIAGNRLNLSIGGVRAYNHENLYSRKTMERFKVFIGFKNLVCCNLCVSTDGLKSDMRVMSVQELFEQSLHLFQQYDTHKHLSQMSQLQQQSLTEHQFAQLIGKTRLYQFLPPKERKILPAMEFTDSHINAIARAYYSDENFAREGTANDIDLWRVYNLFTGANKSSYIDTFLDRSLNATNLVSGIGRALDGDSEYRWFVE